MSASGRDPAYARLNEKATTSLVGEAFVEALAVRPLYASIQGSSSVTATATVINQSLRVTSAAGGTALSLVFNQTMSLNGLLSSWNYTIIPSSGATPLAIRGIAPITSTLRGGTAAKVLNPTTVQLDGTFTAQNLGNYLSFTSAFNTVSYVPIIGILSSSVVSVGLPLIATDPANVNLGDPSKGSIPWTETRVYGVTIQTSKQTNGYDYLVITAGLQNALGQPFSPSTRFTAIATRPSILGVNLLEEGQILVTFSEDMRLDTNLTNPNNYSIGGPSVVTITNIEAQSPTQVTLYTSGLGTGDYVIAVGTVNV